MKDRIKEYYSYLRERIGLENLGGSATLHSLDVPLWALGLAGSAGLYFLNLIPLDSKELLMAYSALRSFLSGVETLMVRQQERKKKQLITPDIASSNLGTIFKIPVAGPGIKGGIDIGKVTAVSYLIPRFVPEYGAPIYLTTEIGLTLFRGIKDGYLLIGESFHRKLINKLTKIIYTK